MIESFPPFGSCSWSSQGAACSSKVDVALEAGFTGAFQQPKERRPLGRASPAPDDNDDAVMRLLLRQLNEISRLQVTNK
jgi:hypothetical protein